MNIVMVSVDQKSASIDLREKLSFTQNGVKEALINIRRNPFINGAVLICTCNRTELYLSCEEGHNINIIDILCKEAKINPVNIIDIFKVKKNDEAVNHLMEVACGLRSMILCEDQIITQVKNAARIAREVKAIDSMLETLFRIAVTCAKKAKTNVKIRAVPTSVAEQAVCFLDEKYGLKNKNILVIGNGEMGRICSSKLVEKGANVTITLRTYKHSMTIVPRGCQTISYDKRKEFISQVEIVISATTSPHYTITRDMVECRDKSLCLVDLALPRDIDPLIKDTKNITCYNIDSLANRNVLDNKEAINRIKEIILDYKNQYYKWYRIHLCQGQVKEIKKIITRRVNCSMDIELDESSSKSIESAIHKTIDIFINSLNDELSPDFLKNMKNNIIKKSDSKDKEDDNRELSKFFPLFIDLKNKNVLVVGGGRIASRRVNTLLEFGAKVKIVAPKVCDELNILKLQNKIDVINRDYLSQDINQCSLVIAATDKREVNQRIGEEAKKAEIFVSVADCKEESTFYFPAVFESENIVGGLVSKGGRNHSLVKESAIKIRQCLKDEEKFYNEKKD